MYNVKIDKKKCIGCGACEAVCPDVFKMDGEKAKIKASKTDKECAKEAADSCPTQAMSVKKI
jgi:ferredoxin